MPVRRIAFTQSVLHARGCIFNRDKNILVEWNFRGDKNGKILLGQLNLYRGHSLIEVQTTTETYEKFRFIFILLIYKLTNLDDVGLEKLISIN